MPLNAGLPDPTPSPDDIQQALAAGGDDLASVGTELASSIGQTLAENHADLATVSRSLKQSLVGSRGANNKLLNPVMQTLGGSITGALSANQTDLASPGIVSNADFCRLHPDAPTCPPFAPPSPPIAVPPGGPPTSPPIPPPSYLGCHLQRAQWPGYYIIGEQTADGCCPVGIQPADWTSPASVQMLLAGPYPDLASAQAAYSSWQQGPPCSPGGGGGSTSPPLPGLIDNTCTPPCPPPGGDCANPLYVVLCPATTTGDQTCPTPTQPGGAGTGATYPASVTGYPTSYPATPPTNGVIQDASFFGTIGSAITGSTGITFGGSGFTPPQQNEAGIPGTAAWCQSISTLVPTLAQLGQQVQQLATSTGNPGIDLVAVAKWALGYFGPAGQAMAAALGAICNGKFELPLQQLLGWVQSAVQALPCFADPQVIGLMVLRSVVSSLERIRVGWDLALWATVDVDVDLREIRQVLDYLSSYLCPQEIPAVGEALECWVRGIIDDPTAFCWVQCHGMYWGTAQLLAQARYERLGARDLIQYQRRMGQDDAWISRKLQQRGISDGEDQVIQQTLYDELPTISDHLHWLQRNVFDDAYVAQYGLLDGFDERFWPRFGDDLTALGMKQEYAQLHYAAHWIIPSPEQLREFVYRLRPDKDGVQNPFTAEDYTNLLAEQDVGPYFRPRLAETINRVPALGYLRDMFRQGIISAEQLRSYHKDLGYSEEDSARFVEIDSIVRDRMRATESHGWTPSSIAQAYMVGILDAATAKILMDDLGWTVDEADAMMQRANAELRYSVLRRSFSNAITGVVTSVKQAVKLGIMSNQDASQQLVNIGYAKQYADAVVSGARSQGDIALTNKTLTAVRSAYLGGKINDGQASNMLSQVGILPDRIPGYISEWALTRTDKVRHRSAGQIVSDLAHGYITTADALARLGNLGYPDADRLLFLADAERKQLALEGQLLSAEQRLAAKRQKAIQDAEKAAEKAHRDALAALNKEASRPTLMKWLRKGLIDRAQFDAAMTARGYESADIERYAEQATS